MKALKIILVDDNKPFRDGIRFYLETVLNHTVIAEASNGSEFLDLDNTKQADTILMDIAMPQTNGIKAAKNYLSHNSHNIIAITSYEEKTYLNELIDAGIKGCVFKKNIHNEINQALKKVCSNEIYYPNEINIIR